MHVFQKGTVYECLEQENGKKFAARQSAQTRPCPCAPLLFRTQKTYP